MWVRERLREREEGERERGDVFLSLIIHQANVTPYISLIASLRIGAAFRAPSLAD